MTTVLAAETASARVMLAIAVLSAGALGLAAVAQYGFDLWPCTLCYYQRVPYGAALALALLSLMPAVDPTARRIIAGHCAGLFAINAGIAGYHVGVEQRWWKGPSQCSGRIQDFSPTDLLAALTQPGRTGCEDPAFTFLGISMAGYNVLACVALTLACVWAMRRSQWWKTI